MAITLPASSTIPENMLVQFKISMRSYKFCQE